MLHAEGAEGRHQRRLPQRLLGAERDARVHLVLRGRSVARAPVRADDAARDEYGSAVHGEEDEELGAALILLLLLRRLRLAARLVRLARHRERRCDAVDGSLRWSDLTGAGSFKKISVNGPMR